MSNKIQSPFPKLPAGLTLKEKRAEIRRRLRISGELGLIGKPKDRKLSK